MHEGSEEPARQLLRIAGIWTYDLHEEIYVFDSGFWSKDHGLWLEVQKADWEDVILKDDFKKKLMKDVFGFFDSEDLYKSLSIPWKVRLLVMTCKGYATLIMSLAWCHYARPAWQVYATRTELTWLISHDR